MININNNKLLSASSQSLTAARNLKPSLQVPFFINPNSQVELAKKEQLLTEHNLQQSASESKGLLPTMSATWPAKAGLPVEVDPVKQLPLVSAQLIQSKPKLVFLQKKGSQIPNPNIISYNFPAAAAASRFSTTSFAKANNLNKLVTDNVYKLLFNFFKSIYCLISKPVFITTPDKIKIQLFYFLCIPKFLINKTVIRKGKGKGKAFGGIGNYNSKDLNVKVNLKRLTQSNLTKVYPHKFKLICAILSKFFNKNVELELIRLHQPYYDSNILVNFLALIINKKNIGACIQRLYNSNIIKANKAGLHLQQAYNNLQSLSVADKAATTPKPAAYLSGLNIQISGRLMREPIIPRITTKKFEKGFTAKGKINYFDLARFTHKNRKGAFTITVKSGQNF
jgi:hypothetical protein